MRSFTRTSIGVAVVAALPLLAAAGTAVRVGDGTVLPGSLNALAAAVADVTGDGVADVVVPFHRAATVRVFPGRGDGTFDASFELSSGGEIAMTRIRTGRVNADAAADFVVDHQNAAILDVFVSDGAGGFARQRLAAADGANGAEFPQFADWDGDGDLDVVSASTDRVFRVRPNDGTGTFGAAQRIDPTGGVVWQPMDFAAADLDADGDVDFVTLDGNALAVWWHDADGTLSEGPRLSRPLATTAWFAGRGIAVGDFDADGRVDLAAVAPSYPGGLLCVFRRTGDTTFAPVETYAVRAPYDQRDLATADLNGDGCDEIVTPSQFLVNRGDGTFGPAADLPSPAPSAYGASGGPAAGDLDGDATPDVVVADWFLGVSVRRVSEELLLPAITSVAPSSVYAGATREIVLRGANFDEGAAVSVLPEGSVNSVTRVDGTSLRVSVTTGAPGMHVLEVLNADGGSGTAQLDVLDGGVAGIASVVPSEGFAGDAVAFEVRGSGFLGGAEVTIGGTRADVTSTQVVGEDRLVVHATIAVDAAPGPRDVVVVNGSGLTTTAPAAFRVLPPRSLDLRAWNGRLVPSPRARRDTFSVGGNVAFNGFSGDLTFDPTTESATLRFGHPADPVVVAIPADAGWKVRRGRMTWQSPRGAAPRVKLTLDFRRGTFALSASGFDLPTVPTGDVLVRFDLGDDVGVSARRWNVQRDGSLTLR